MRLGTTGGERRVALFPGLTWFVTQHAELILTPTDGTEPRTLGRRALVTGTWTSGEQLVRSTAGVLAPAVLVGETPGGRDAHYVNLSERLVSTAARPQRAERVWLGGRAAGPQISLDPPTSIARFPVEPGAESWLEVGPEGRAVLHAPAGTGLFSLPLLGPPAERVPVENGSLVKGSSARLHVVLDGTLHWLPTLESLQRRGPIPRLTALRDEELWRLPVGLPME